MAETAAETLGLTRTPTPEQMEVLHAAFVDPLIAAINQTPAMHRAPHIGCIIHFLLTELPNDERQKAIEYVFLVLKREAN